MKAAKVSELKAGLSKYLARVKRGEQVVITERGKPVAKLVPLPPRPEGMADTEWARLLDLERRGVLKLPERLGLPPGFWDWERPKVPDGWLENWLEWERGGR